MSRQDICPSAWERTRAAWWLVRRVNVLSKAAVFIFKIQALSDSNMPGGIILHGALFLLKASREREKLDHLDHQVLLIFCIYSIVCSEMWGIHMPLGFRI